MTFLRKYWRHFNLAGASATFLFGIFLLIWGANAVAPYDSGLDTRIDGTTQIEIVRAECHEMNAKIKFSQGAGFSLGQIEVVFLCLIFALFAFNIRLIRQIEATEKARTSV